MRIRSVMTTKVATASPDDHLDQVLERMTAGGYRHLPVVEDGRLIGIVSRADTREHVGHLSRSKVSGAMTAAPKTVTPETSVAEAARTMVREAIGALPVVEDGRLVGIVTASDLLGAFVALEEDLGPGIRIDLRLDAAASDLEGATEAITEAGGRLLGVGGDVAHADGDSVVCMHVDTENAARVTDALRRRGYGVVAVHH
jgi:acetoin utilization protein AcuB